jgi:hypothetical protein
MRAMTARRGWLYPAGATRRLNPNPDPVVHAMTDIPAARVRDTGTRLALCGATLQPGVLPRSQRFDPYHRRACAACAKPYLAANPDSRRP